MWLTWTEHLIAAARHSPQAFDFVKTQIVIPRTSKTHDQDEKDRATKVMSMILDHGLPYEITFQCTPNTVEFSYVLDMLTATCPNWYISPSPNCDYYYNDGIPNRDELIEMTTNNLTMGGFPYERLVVFVNKSAAAMIKLYDIVDDIKDYSDVMEKYKSL